MDRIDDPRVLFYLKHQTLIEEWAAVRKDVAGAAHEFYWSIGQRLEERASSLGPDVLAFPIPNASWPLVGYHRFGWPLNADDQPVVGVFLQWKQGTTTFTDGSRSVGLRIDMNDPSGIGLREAITARIKDGQANAGFPHRANWWPAYSDITTPSHADYWENLNPYSESIVELIESAWNEFSPAVDIAVSTAQELSPQNHLPEHPTDE